MQTHCEPFLRTFGTNEGCILSPLGFAGAYMFHALGSLLHALHSPTTKAQHTLHPMYVFVSVQREEVSQPDWRFAHTMHIQYPSDARYKANAFHTRSERVSHVERTCLGARANAFRKRV